VASSKRSNEETIREILESRVVLLTGFLDDDRLDGIDLAAFDQETRSMLDDLEERS
jgi:hypothetical protein